MLVNKINPHEVCSDVTRNSRSAIQLLFPPYQPKYDLRNRLHKQCDKRIRLVRKTLPGVFSYEYHLPSANIVYNFYNFSSSSGGGAFSNPSIGAQPPQTPAPLSLDLENDLPSVFQFTVGVNDIGGTLVAELAINQGRVSDLERRGDVLNLD